MSEYPKSLLAYYKAGHKLACHYRAEGITEVGTKEWFFARQDPEAFNFKEKWIYDAEHYRSETSDEFYESLAEPDKAKMETRERNRLKNGLIVTVPSFERLPKNAQAALRKEYPMAGKCVLLSPYHYLELCYAQLWDNTSAEFVNAIYRRRDDYFFDMLTLMERYPLADRERREKLLTFKKRSVGYTVMIKCRAITRMITNPGWLHMVAPGPDHKIGDFSAEFAKICKSIEGHASWLFPPLYKGTGNRMVRESNFQSAKSENITRLYFENKKNIQDRLHSRYVMAIHKATAFETYRPSAIDVDESGIVEGTGELARIVNKASSSLSDKTTYEKNLLTLGGTSDEYNPNNDYLHEMRMQPEQLAVHIFFYGAQHAGTPDKYGYTDEAKAIAMETAQRAKLEAVGEERLREYVVKNPITVDDCFLSNVQQLLPTQRMGRRVEDLKKMLDDPQHPQHFKILRGIFEPHPTMGVRSPVFKPSYKLDPSTGNNVAAGGWHILADRVDVTHKLPNKKAGKLIPDLVYVAGADNITKNTFNDSEFTVDSEMSNRSQNAMVVMNLYDHEIVAYYINRYNYAEKDWDQFLLGALYFNCWLNPEVNLDRCINYLRDYRALGMPQNFFLNYLMPKPDWAGGNYSPGKRIELHKIDRGFRTTDGIGNNANGKKRLFEQFVAPFWEDHTETCRFPTMISHNRKWDIDEKKNTPDLGMALMMALICSKVITDIFKPDPHRAMAVQASDAAQMFQALKNMNFKLGY